MNIRFFKQRLSSIQNRLGIIYLAFLFLLVISVVVTFIGINIQNQDARIINLAGRQRMLLQQMSSLALGYSQDHDRAEWYKNNIAETTASFEETLSAMQSGGKITDYTGNELTLSPPADLKRIDSLKILNLEWERYKANIDSFLTAADPAEQQTRAHEIEQQSHIIIEKADQIVREYEDITNLKLARLKAYQAAFLLGGLLVLGTGWWTTRHSLVLPLGQLAKAAQHIGGGQLEDSVPVEGLSEVQVLSETMDHMRQQILTEQQSLQQWAQTLEDRVLQRTRELEALAIVSGEITSNLAIGDVLSSVARKARELSGADTALVCLLDKEGKVLNLHATDGPPDSVKNLVSSAEHPTVSRILGQSCGHPCEFQACDAACQTIDKKFLASHVAASLHSKGRVIGALCIGSQAENAFRPEIKTMLNQLAGVTAVALENSRLYQQADTLATIHERQRLASEMHDGSLQTLSYIRIMARWAKDQFLQGDTEKAASSLKQIERALNQAEQEIRRAIASLEDDFPLNYTLQEQLTVLAAEISKGNIPVEFQSETRVPIVLDYHESEQALRIAREAVTNAQKHSRSERILVTLGLDDSRQDITLKVKDFGVGFVPRAPSADDRPHFGIKIMHARASRLGGEVTVNSTANVGTEVIFCWHPSTLSIQAKEA